MSQVKDKKNIYDEVGRLGLEVYYGLIYRSFYKHLQWPEAQIEYNRLRVTDPEIGMIRTFFNALAGGVSLRWEIPPDADDDLSKKALAFCESVTDELKPHLRSWLETAMSQVPFFGWGWWEIVFGLRREGWSREGWESAYNDGLVGVRSLAFRDTSSFSRWNYDDRLRLRGMYQRMSDSLSSEEVMLPLDRSIHVVFGDIHNPEGVSPLASVWRLEQVQRSLQLIQGIGFEHAAGYLQIMSDKNQLTGADKTMIETAARNILTAQEGNYALFPPQVRAELVDGQFSAAATILEAIRYMGLIKLSAYQCQFLAMGTMANTGAYEAVKEGFNIFLTQYNAMVTSFTQQLSDQLVSALFRENAATFGALKTRPRLISEPLTRGHALTELAAFSDQIARVIRLGDADEEAIRKASGILEGRIPDDAQYRQTITAIGHAGEMSKAVSALASDHGSACECESCQTTADLSRKFYTEPDELPLDVRYMATITDSDRRRALSRWAKICRENNRPDLVGLLSAKPVDDADEMKG